MIHLVGVDSGFAVFGFVVKDGIVSRECAPITKWAIGKRGDYVISYWKRRGATVKRKELK